MQPAAKTSLLSNIPLLARLLPAQLATLAEHSHTQSYKDQDILFYKGDTAQNIYLILKGQVEVIIETQPVTHRVSILGPDQLFGELALLNDIGRNATLRAFGELEVLRIDATVFFDLLRQNPDFALDMMRQLGDKLANSHEYAAELRKQILQLQKSHLIFRDGERRALTSDRERFSALWRRNLIDGAVDHSADYHRQMLNAYSEPQRVYHTLQHIEDCLSLFDRIKTRPDSADALEIAIWYHDAVYEIGARDNERKSADLFLRHSEAVFDDQMRETVEQHIMATLHQGKPLENADSEYMVDIDLASFGKPWSHFILDAEKVRKEMPHIPDHLFYPSQFAFQNTLLDRRRFFQSDYFYERYEETARYNLSEYSKLIERITSQDQG